jgi:hypothetical protein
MKLHERGRRNVYKYKYKYLYQYGLTQPSTEPSKAIVQQEHEIGRVESASRVCRYLDNPAPCDGYYLEGHRSSINFNLSNIPEGTTHYFVSTEPIVTFHIFRDRRGLDESLYEHVGNGKYLVAISNTQNWYIADPDWHGNPTKDFWIYFYAYTKTK